MDKKKYIDLFAGCGGLSLGLYNTHQWKGVFAIEKSSDAFSTLKHNLIENKNHFIWPKWLPKSHHDIQVVTKKYENELKNLRGEIELVAGGPPCQGFSSAGKRYENDERNKLIESYVKFIRLVQPKVIFFENVKGFTQGFKKNRERGRVYSEYVKKALRRTSQKFGYEGYNVYGELVNFSEFGIPQKRTRFILIGVRNDLSNELFPPKQFFTHLRNNRFDFLSSKEIRGSITLAEAISDLSTKKLIPSRDTPNFKTTYYSKIESDYQRLLRKGCRKKIPDSHRFANHNPDTIKKFEYFLTHSEEGKQISEEVKRLFGIKKRTVILLSGDSQAPTLTTLPDDYIHYSEPRIFTVREYARIQSFNDWYEIKGKYTTGGKQRVKEVPRYSQLGNAIPPLFGELAGITLNKLIG